MTGDWTGAGGGVQVVRSGHIEGSEVPVVVLNNIQLSTYIKIYPIYSIYHIFIAIPDTSHGICSRRDSLTTCLQSSRETHRR